MNVGFELSNLSSLTDEEINTIALAVQLAPQAQLQSQSITTTSTITTKPSGILNSIIPTNLFNTNTTFTTSTTTTTTQSIPQNPHVTITIPDQNENAHIIGFLMGSFFCLFGLSCSYYFKNKTQYIKGWIIPTTIIGLIIIIVTSTT
eukprot:TRINITY_DN7739_c1_g1_i1.p1 TRINITY_DN7739_c1_g1~~TRINITY_DN7739_c1_g1_i1.p1  ORF type:complete len:147 (+),score=54.29 TRINITY_DN7739_c1_g1_i1:113-553(+)